MRHWFSLSLVCCAQLLASGCADLNSPVIDYPGISTTAITSTSITISWNKASDGLSPQTALVYNVYRSGPNPTYLSFSTIGQVEAGTWVATLTDASSATITGLTAGSTYYINVVVQDEAGNKAVYDPLGEFVDTSQLAYYPFNGSGKDVVGTNHFVVPVATGIVTPTQTLDRFGHVASAYNFAPTATTSQCMQSTANVGITGTAVRTVSFWVQSANTTATSPRVPFAWGDGSASGSAFGAYETGTGSYWTAWLGGASIFASTTTVTSNWEHWVIGYNRVNVLAYKNGVSVISAPATPATVDGLLYVGCAPDPTGTTLFPPDTLGYPYTGKIDDLRIFNVSPTTIDIASLYEATRP